MKIASTNLKMRSGNSIQRNPILASFVAKGLLPYRGLGTGVRRALKDWSNIQFIDDREGCLFISIIERIKVHPSPKSIKKSANKGALKVQNASINAPISSLKVQILEILRENPQASYEEIAKTLNKDRTTIMRNIRGLKDEGILRRAGSKKTGHWEIVNE